MDERARTRSQMSCRLNFRASSAPSTRSTLPVTCRFHARSGWATVVKDCCHGNAPVDYLLYCDEHWAMIRFQQLPGQCRRCGRIAYSVADIVSTEIPLGRTAEGAWPLVGRDIPVPRFAE